MTGRPRIAWVVKAWATGGAERTLVDLAAHLSPHVDVLPIAAHREPDDLVPALVRAGLAPLPLPPGVAPWPLRLRRAVRTERVDVVHFHGPYVGALGRPALAGAPVAIVHTEHSVWSSHRRPSRLANAASYPMNDAVAAVSGAVAGEIRSSLLGRLVRDRLRVIGNGIDAADVRADASGAAPSVDVTSPSYVCVGHLRARKGVDVLLDASLEIARKLPAARGIVVGDGEDAVALREQQRRIGAHSVSLVGHRDDARAIIAAGDVFVVPSRTEGMPLAVLEAMALGRPIVATRVGGLPELLTHEHDALLVPPEDPFALAAAVVRLLEDRSLAATLGSAAHATVQQKAGAGSTAAAYLDLYAAALRRAGMAERGSAAP